MEIECPCENHTPSHFKWTFSFDSDSDDGESVTSTALSAETTESIDEDEPYSTSDPQFSTTGESDMDDDSEDRESATSTALSFETTESSDDDSSDSTSNAIELDDSQFTTMETTAVAGTTSDGNHAHLSARMFFCLFSVEVVLQAMNANHVGPR